MINTNVHPVYEWCVFSEAAPPRKKPSVKAAVAAYKKAKAAKAKSDKALAVAQSAHIRNKNALEQAEADLKWAAE